MASNYTCSGGCICPATFSSLQVLPSSWDMLPGDTKLFAALEWRIDCNNFSFSLELTGGPWTSSYHPVATVTPGGGLVTAGQTGGSTSIILGPINTYIYIPIFHYPVWQCQTQLIHPQCGGTVRVRQTKWAVLVSDTGVQPGSEYCLTPGVKHRQRQYLGYDDFGQVPFDEYWIFVENGESCGATTGGEGRQQGVLDYVSNCWTDCTILLHQRFNVGKDRAQALGRQVNVRNCANFSDPSCAAHAGYLVDAILTNITVTDE
jgi:hypothetical protein